jgi:hypothetical protein
VIAEGTITQANLNARTAIGFGATMQELVAAILSMSSAPRSAAAKAAPKVGNQLYAGEQCPTALRVGSSSLRWASTTHVTTRRFGDTSAK